MSSFEFGFPDVAYAGEDEDKYKWLKDDDLSPFKGYTMADIFIFAMSYGFFNKKGRKALVRPQKNMPPDAFKPEMRNLMRAVAIDDQESIGIIKDHSEVVKICEEYANAAIGDLYNLIFGQLSNKKDLQILEDMVRAAENSRSQN